MLLKPLVSLDLSGCSKRCNDVESTSPFSFGNLKPKNGDMKDFSSAPQCKKRLSDRLPLELDKILEPPVSRVDF